MNDLSPARPHGNGKGVLVTPARLRTARQAEETKAPAADCATCSHRRRRVLLMLVLRALGPAPSFAGLSRVFATY